MTTTFKGHKTGFKSGKSNTCAPNEMGPPSTKFSGRGAVPEGPFKRFPGAVADISNGNRRLSKSNYGADGSDGVTFRGRGALSRVAGAKSGGSPMGDGMGRGAMKSNKK
jgi:hypothetical protein